MTTTSFGPKNTARMRATLRALVSADQPLRTSDLPSNGTATEINLRTHMKKIGYISLSKADRRHVWSITDFGRKALADDAAGLVPLEIAHQPPGRVVLAKRLEERLMPVPNSGCHIWLGNLTTSGYGYLNNRVLPSNEVHRIAFILANGSVPEGLVLDHLCRVRCCANPAHLEPVTSAENSYRGDTIAAKYRARTHCDKGHPFEGENLALTPRGARRCRTCSRDSARRAQQRRKTKIVQEISP